MKTNFSVSTGTTCGFKLFLKVLNRFGLSAETFGMVLKFLSTCPDENLRKKYFFYSSFLIFFRILSEKLFRVLAKRLQEFVKTTFYVSRGTICGLIFFKFWKVSDFLQKHLAWLTKFYLRVQSKNCGKKPFFCSLSRIFSDFEQKLFRVLAKKLQEFVKTTFYVSRGTICGLIFFKFWNVSDFLQKHLAWLTKFYPRVQSKNCGKKVFFCFLSRIFFNFWAEIFLTFGQKTSRICQNYLLRFQRNNLWLEILF